MSWTRSKRTSNTIEIQFLATMFNIYLSSSSITPEFKFSLTWNLVHFRQKRNRYYVYNKISVKIPWVQTFLFNALKPKGVNRFLQNVARVRVLTTPLVIFSNFKLWGICHLEQKQNYHFLKYGSNISNQN